MSEFRTPPEGWFTFGTHVDKPGPLEFSREVDEALMPLWERPAWVDEERWVPVTESGARWVGRSKAMALRDMETFAAGGHYDDGAPRDGITHIERETRRVTEWTVGERIDPTPRRQPKPEATESESA